MGTLIDNIPLALRQEPRWLVWKAGPVKPDGKFGKVPVDPATGHNLTGDVSSQCMTFDKAVAALSTGHFSGLGFHPKGSRFIVGDIDRVVGASGSIAPWALEDIGGLATYCEVSPSGTGLRWVAEGTKPGPKTNNHAQGCELYDGSSSQFLTITGDVLPGFDLIREDAQAEVNAWYWRRIAKGPATAKAAQAEGPGNSLTAEEVKARLLSNEKGRKLWEGEYSALGYPSRSEHALGLLDQLAALTAGDVEKMREVYFESPFASLYDDKAERTFSGDAAKAIQGAQGRFLLDTGGLFKAVGVPSGYTAEELLDLDIPEVRWAVLDLLPAGLGILAGRPKLGKSWAALQMCIAVAEGGEFLGFSCQEGEAVYLALEDGKKRLQSRLRKLLQGKRPPSGLTFFNEWRPLDQGGLEDLDGLLASRPGVRLLVMDTWQKCRPISKPRGASAYEVDYAEAGKLKTLADKRGVCLLLIHHLRKSDPSALGGDIMEKVNGSTGITGAADSILILDRCRNVADAELHVTGRDISEGVHALTRNTDTMAWSYAGNGQSLARTPEQQKVLDTIKRLKTASPKEVAEDTGLGGDYCKKAVGRLLQQGLINRVEYGRYTVNEVFEAVPICSTP